MVDQESLLIDWLRHTAPIEDSITGEQIIRMPVTLPPYLHHWMQSNQKYRSISDVLVAHPVLFVQKSKGEFLVLNQASNEPNSGPTIPIVPRTSLTKVLLSATDEPILEGVSRYLRSTVYINLETINQLLAQKMGHGKAPALDHFVHRYSDVFHLHNGTITLQPELRAMGNTTYAQSGIDDVKIISMLVSFYVRRGKGVVSVANLGAAFQQYAEGVKSAYGSIVNYIRTLPTLFRVYEDDMVELVRVRVEEAVQESLTTQLSSDTDVSKLILPNQLQTLVKMFYGDLMNYIRVSDTVYRLTGSMISLKKGKTPQIDPETELISSAMELAGLQPHSEDANLLKLVVKNTILHRKTNNGPFISSRIGDTMSVNAPKEWKRIRSKGLSTYLSAFPSIFQVKETRKDTFMLDFAPAILPVLLGSKPNVAKTIESHMVQTAIGLSGVKPRSAAAELLRNVVKVVFSLRQQAGTQFISSRVGDLMVTSDPASWKEIKSKFSGLNSFFGAYKNIFKLEFAAKGGAVYLDFTRTMHEAWKTYSDKNVDQRDDTKKQIVEQLAFAVAHVAQHSDGVPVLELDLEAFNFKPKSLLAVRKEYRTYKAFLAHYPQLFEIVDDNAKLVAGLSADSSMDMAKILSDVMKRSD